MTSPVGAQVSWDNTTGIPNPFYHRNDNWVGNNAPGATDTALFDIDAAYEVWWNSTTESLTPEVGSVHVDQGQVTFRSVQLGGLRKLQINGAGGDGQYSDFRVSGAGTSLSLYGVHLHSLGKAQLTDGASLHVGGAGEPASLFETGNNFDVSGNLYIHAASKAITGHNAYIGTSIGSTGSAHVSGAGSEWNVANEIYVGNFGDGSLDIDSGGLVESSNGYVALFTTAAGTANVSGSGSRWNNAGSLYVGGGGLGTLTISQSGEVSSGVTYIGSSGSGNAVVSGNGSQLNNAGNLIVGRAGSGSLRLENGGAATNVNGYIGLESGSSGEVTVTGNGSQWNNGISLYIGDSGNGTLSVTNGGTVNSVLGYVGSNNNSMGLVQVAGSASQWNNSAGLAIGRFGDGTLEVTDGGSVNSGIGYVGYSLSATGLVTVSGPGSVWNSSDTLFVGRSGDGTVDVTSGGKLNTLDCNIGLFANSTGTISVNGSGSQWDNNGSLSVGVSGTGTLSVTAGATVNSIEGALGSHSGSSGTATVSGVGSRWNNSGDFAVGGTTTSAGGIGVLTLADGGLVTVNGTTRIWSTGTVNLSGGRFEFGQTSLNELSSIQASSGALAGIATHDGYTDVASLTYLQNPNVDMRDVGVANSGFLFGNGSVDAALLNEATGEVETLLGERMRFAGNGNVNHGEINNFGGSIRFDQDLTNGAGGFITGRGTFAANGGWDNQGVLALVGGYSDVQGDFVNRLNGQVIVSGGSTATFYDDVTHNGFEMRTAAGSSLVFLGEVTGSGDFTGTGTVFMEGDLRPGNSPGIVTFAGDLVLGSNAVLQAELAGLETGMYDQLFVAGDLELNGMLEVELLNDFLLTYNDHFLLTSVGGALQGQFVGLNEGSLVGNFQGMDLFITYSGGDGNDVVLFTAVPEPSAFQLLALGLAAVSTRSRRRRLTA